MNFIQWLKYRVLGKKPKSSGDDMIPRGLTHSTVPESFDKKIIWDRDKFDNLKIIKDE